MLSQSFEIKVGLLGHVSVGKTTGLNALLQEKFSEVSMKRTTAGINLFRISSLAKSSKRAKLSTSNVNEESMDWQEVNDAASAGSETSYTNASDTLKETTSDNARLRTTNELQEKIFDIELDEPLLKDMRDDTRLVIVDIPGINEAGTQKIYLDYVSSTWDSFDAMIVVMDAKQGVNTDEQIGLLNFVKKNLDSKKQIPIILVCNKVDDPDDDELMALVGEAQREVEKLFAVGDRSRALKAITSGKGTACYGPIFLPTSFENAFLYRTASRLPVGELKRLDKVYIDKIGHEEMGKFKWKKLSDDKKYELVNQIVSDPAQYKERLEASNFHKLLEVLQYFLGGKETQKKVIEKQLDVALSKMSLDNDEGQLFTDQLIAVFDRSKALGKETSSLIPKFWALYKDLKADAFSKLRSNHMNIDALGAPMKELIKYAKGLQNELIRCHGAEDENERKIVVAMKGLIKQQIAVVIEEAGKWNPQSLTCNQTKCSQSYPDRWRWNESNSSWYNYHSGEYLYTTRDEHPGDQFVTSWQYNSSTEKWRSMYSMKEVEGTKDENPASKPAPPLSSWAGMSPKDWSTIIGSILLISRHKAFYEAFGQEIIDLDWMAQHATFSKPSNYCFTCSHSHCTHSSHCKPLTDYHDFEKGKYIDGVFTPNNKAKYDRVVQIKVPDSPSNPSHWGHLAWLFCKYMESLEA